MTNYEHKTGRIPLRITEIVDGFPVIMPSDEGPIVGYLDYEIIGATECPTCGYDSLIHAYVGADMYSACDRCPERTERP